MIKPIIRAGLLAFALVALAFPGQADARSLDDIIKEGVVRIGVEPNLPGLSAYNTKNELEGMDIDTAHLIADALGAEVEFVITKTQQRVPYLVSDRIDICLAGLTRNARRAKLVDYTLPTYTESQVILTTDKHADITEWQQLNDAKYTLANVRSTVPASWTRKNVPNAKELLLDSGADVIRAIAQGRADGTIAIIDNWLKFAPNYPNVKWRVVPKTIYLGYWGMGVRRGNDALRRWLNIWIYDHQSKNKHNELWEKWFASPPAFPVVPTPYFP
jgi:polar amino acid transport system substrate-binding protein